MDLRSVIGRGATACGGLLLGATAFTPAALAHYYDVSPSCGGGLVVTLQYYAENTPSTITIWIDGQVRVDTTFINSFSDTESFGDLGVAHTYRVAVNEPGFPDGTFDTGAVTFEACDTSTTTASTEAPTTTAVDSGGGEDTTTTQAATTTTAETTTTDVASEGPTTTTQVGDTSGSLPSTGSNDTVQILAGVGLLVMGGALMIAGRRRRPAQS